MTPHLQATTLQSVSQLTFFPPLSCYSIVQYCFRLLEMETWYEETINCTIVWIVLLNRLNFFQKKTSRFLLSWFNSTIFHLQNIVWQYCSRKISFHPNVMNQYSQNVEVVWFSLRNKLAFPKTRGCTWSRYQSTYSIIAVTYRKVNCCTWFLASQIWWAENAKRYIFIWFVLIIKFDSSK